MKKRISALVLSSCLLAGCAGQGAAATGETAAPSQAVPTAAPQSLTVNGLLDTSAAVGALELYAQAQNVTLQNSFETETADLVILDAPPQDDGTWKNLAENELLAAAAQRAGLDTESTVTALPVGQSLYAYWADNRVLTELLQSDAALDDLRAATWEEWFDFVTAVTHWCAEPGAVQVTLNGNVYTLPAERRETLANLNGVFAAQGPEVSGNSGDGGVAENTPALYTTALLAAGEPLTEENLTGPLNALEQELRLEDANSAWQAGIADLWTSKYLFQQGNALFYRGYLADLISDSGAALSSAQKDALVWLPIKNNLTEADIANQRFNLAGLMNYPILANRAWLAIPADADEESARAAAAAIMWLYTSKAGESALIDTLDLITPWGTGSNQNAAAAMQAAQVTAGILPGAALNQTQAAALQQAQRGLYYEADGITLRDGLWDEDAAAAWRSAVMAALGAESAGHGKHIVAADRHHAVGQLHDEARCAKADDIADAAPVGGQLTQGQRLHAVFRLAAQEIHNKRRRKQLRKHRGSSRAADAHAQHKDKHRVQHQVGRCADHHAEHTGCGIALRIDERVQPCCEHGRVGAQQVQHQVRQRILQCFRRSTE